MADQSLLQRIASALIGRSADSGITGAAQTLNNRAYQLHVQEARAMGQQPLSPQQFAMQQQAQAQAQMQAPVQPAPEPKPFQF